MALLGKRKTRSAQSAWTPDGQQGWRVGGPGSTHSVRSIKVYWENGQMARVPYLSIRHHDGSETCVAACHYDVWFRA